MQRFQTSDLHLIGRDPAESAILQYNPVENAAAAVLDVCTQHGCFLPLRLTTGCSSLPERRSAAGNRPWADAGGGGGTTRPQDPVRTLDTATLVVTTLAAMLSG